MDQLGFQRRQSSAAPQGEQAKADAERQHRVGTLTLGLQVVHLVEGAAIGFMARGDQPVAGEVREHRDAGGVDEGQELGGDP